VSDIKFYPTGAKLEGFFVCLTLNIYNYQRKDLKMPKV